MTCIGRSYSSEHQAQQAMSALREQEFDDSMMALVTPMSLGSPATPERFQAAVSHVGELRASLAVSFARSIGKGLNVLVVNAPLGYGLAAENALDGAGPVDPGGPDMVLDRNPSPLSDLLGLPVLSTRGLSSLSRMFSPLSQRKFFLSSGKVSNNPAPLSSMVGLKTVSTKPMKESSFGLPLLKRQKGPWTRSFGFPLLTKKQ